MTLEISIVIPVYNEAGAIAGVLRHTAAVMRAGNRSFEILVVNDGSLDETSAQIQSAAAELQECRELSLPRHAGQGAALLAGLAEARGRWIVTLDGDGQNDPADIPALLEPIVTDTADLVCGWRQRRADGWLRIVMSKIANGVRRRVLRDGVHDSGCQLRAFRREVISALHPMELVQSFVPALAAAAGFRIAERTVRHHPRQHGQSKYGLSQLGWRPAIAMLKLRRDLKQVAETSRR